MGCLFCTKRTGTRRSTAPGPRLKIWSLHRPLYSVVLPYFPAQWKWTSSWLRVFSIHFLGNPLAAPHHCCIWNAAFFIQNQSPAFALKLVRSVRTSSLRCYVHYRFCGTRLRWITFLQHKCSTMDTKIKVQLVFRHVLQSVIYTVDCYSAVFIPCENSVKL